jgi:transcriptional regulator with XRE-family HTH domain
MSAQSQPTASDIISDFRGVYARIARKLGVSASMVSRVADGSRASTEIDAALHEELKVLKVKLDKYL